MTHNTAIFSRNRTDSERCNQVRSYSGQAEEKTSIYVSNRTEATLDGRKTNIGCAMRHNWSSWKKVEFVDGVLQAINEVSVATVTWYYCDINKCVPAEVERPRNRM